MSIKKTSLKRNCVYIEKCCEDQLYVYDYFDKKNIEILKLKYDSQSKNIKYTKQPNTHIENNWRPKLIMNCI